MGVEANQIAIPNYKDLEIVKTGRISLAWSFSSHTGPTSGLDIASTIVSHNLGYAPILVMTLDNGTGAYETITSGSVQGNDVGDEYFTQYVHRFIVSETTLFIYLHQVYSVTNGTTAAQSATYNYIYYLLRQHTV